MAEPVILRIDVLKAMDSGQAFDIAWIEYDVRRGTGGALRQEKGWMKVSADKDRDFNTTLPGERINKNDALRDPEHRANETINIYNPKLLTQHITKIHWQLVTMFNGCRVIN